jgi:hypothetical protein
MRFDELNQENVMRSLPLLLSAIALVGCAGSSGDGTFDPSTYTGAMSGAMELRLVDAPNPDVTAVVVTITHVDAHIAGAGWVTLSSKKVTVDLLSLQGGTFASLGVTALPAGNLTQLRLYTDDAGPNYVITPDGAQHPLDIPSGDESGIKLKLGIQIDACASGSITLDFDGHKSIWTHPRGGGAGDLWQLRPVVRLRAVTQTGTCSDGGTTPAPSTGSDGGITPAPSTGSDGGVTPGPDGNTIDTTLPSSGGGTVENPNPPTIGTGAPSDCGGMVCADGETCVNNVCTAPGIYLY